MKDGNGRDHLPPINFVDGNIRYEITLEVEHWERMLTAVRFCSTMLPFDCLVVPRSEKKADLVRQCSNE